MNVLFRVLFLVIIFCFSCKNNSSDSKKTSETETVSKPVIVIHRAKQHYKPAGSPQITKALVPKTFQTNSNTIFVDELTTITAETDLFTATPGKDTLLNIKSIAVSPKVELCKQPIPTKAMPPRFKDAAISDIQYLDVDQGLMSSMLKSVIVDKKGNIWIGSNNAGVSKYDGESFINYTQKNGLSNNTVLTIFEDSKGTIWFGTEGGGVCWFDGRNFYSLTTNEGLGNNTVLAIYEDKIGNMWFGTNGGGAFCYDGKSLTAYTEKEGLSNNMVRCILQDKNGNMWFGTTGSGACKFNGESFTYFGERAGLNSTIIHAMTQDTNGNIYFATEDGGVNVYDGKEIKYITKKRGLSSDCVVSLQADSDDVLWIGTYDKGLCKFSNKQITCYSTEQGLTNNYILGLAKDVSGSIWMATYGGGLCKFNTSSFAHYTANEGIGNNTIRSMAIDNSGNLVFGTFGDGIIFYSGNSFNHYTEKEGLASNRILTIINSGTNLWFGTEQNGVVKYDGKNFETYTTEQGLTSDYIKCAFKDKDGTIWFGTDEGGVCGFDGKQFISFVEEEGLSEGVISSITQDNNGNLWFATEGSGACCYDGKFLKWFTTKTGLCDNTINCIVKDKDGNIWLGGNSKGLSMISANSINSATPVIKNFDIKDGLSNLSIKSIAQDKIGNIWIATEFGLNYIVKQNTTFKTIVYTTADGLKANNFMKNSVIIDNDNVVWWGNGKALTNLNLNKYQLPITKPVLQLTSIELEKTFVDFFALKDSSQKNKEVIVGVKDKKNLRKVEFDDAVSFYNYPKNLSLPHNINQLDFMFSAIDWGATDKIRYQYMLAGADADWSPLTKENKALYNNLPNGDYVFKLKAIGIANNWSEVIEYPFTIRAPWYKTIWAYLLYIVAFFGIVMGFNNIRTRQLKARQEELETLVTERTAEVVEQKELIEEKQKEIVDSINYAKRIQSALLASNTTFEKAFKANFFIFYQPKDIVSGDFYWASNSISEGASLPSVFTLVTGDCTGHGVPGAFMSLLNISYLTEALNERKYTEPAQILDYIRKRIINSLSTDGSIEGGKDGMDCSLVRFDLQQKTITLSAANNPVWIIRTIHETNGEQSSAGKITISEVNPNLALIEFKGDKMPVGRHIKQTEPFTTQTFTLKAGDIVYTLTDGVIDQFGGPHNKKITSKGLKNFLFEIYHLPIKEQKTKIDTFITNWKGKQKQIDDMLLIGIKIE